MTEVDQTKLETVEAKPDERSLASMGRIRVEKTREDAIVPERKNKGDAGLDLAIPEGEAIFPGEQQLIGLGFKIGIPFGYEGQIRPRSSYCYNRKLTVPNSPGTVDSGYRDEVKVLLYNYGNEAQHLDPGDRVAQLVVNQIWTGTLAQQDIPTDSDRGGGFGSTGT